MLPARRRLRFNRINPRKQAAKNPAISRTGMGKYHWVRIPNITNGKYRRAGADFQMGINRVCIIDGEIKLPRKIPRKLPRKMKKKFWNN